MKPVALLAIAIFLISAPAPDSKTISEASYGFIADTKSEPLLADESRPTFAPMDEVSETETQLDNG